jgi:hypothetical protein
MPKRTDNGHQGNQQQVEADPGRRPVVHHVVVGQCEGEIDGPGDQHERPADHDPQPAPPDPARHGDRHQLGQGSLKPSYQLTALGRGHRSDLGIGQHAHT